MGRVTFDILIRGYPSFALETSKLSTLLDFLRSRWALYTFVLVKGEKLLWSILFRRPKR